MKHNNLKGSAILCLAALIWGLAFVAQTDAAEFVPPFAFNALRSVIAGVFLLVILSFMNRKSKEELIPKDPKKRKVVIKGGILCGFMLAVSANFQQFGLALYPEGASSEARGGFLTALYVILVPIFSVFLRKKISPTVLIAVVIAMGGIYLLCLSGGIGGIYLGDVLMLICAVCFTMHIMLVDKFVAEVGGVRLSMLQMFVCGILSAIMSVIFEGDTFTVSGVMTASLQILYMGIMSSGIAYTLQIIGQRYAEPTVASISMSLESVFAALGGWVIAGNALSAREIFGCILVFVAITVAQIPSRSVKEKA